MLDESDIFLIAQALKDRSLSVQHAALRVIALLLPLVRSEGVFERVQELTNSSEPGLRALATRALEKARDSTPAGFDQRSSIMSAEEHESVPTPFATLEQSRATFGSATDLFGRLYPALSLALRGETDWIERVLEEIERGPLNLEAVRYVRDEGQQLYPLHVAEQLLLIARDEARRGDVRQIAYLLACRSIDVGEPPYNQDLAEVATEVAERYIAGGGIDHSDFEALHYLEPEPAALLITALFDRCLPETLEPQGYMAGNEVVRAVGVLGRSFVPDIPALFEFYLETFRRASAARMEWYNHPDEDIVFFSDGGSSLAVGWQIAWTVARAGLRDVIAGLAPFLDSIEEEERLAALALLEDAIRYMSLGPPLFGGVSEPATDTAVVVQGVRSTLVAAGNAGFEIVQVFYGTNREPTGSTSPSQYYGPGEGSLSLGVCKVSIPTDHEIGKLESPAWHTMIHRVNPARYVILQNVEQKSESAFCESLKESVHSSSNMHALIFVHGYRVSFEDAARRTAQLATDLKISIPLFFSWPSRARLRGYGADETLAQRAVPELMQFLDLVAAKSGAEVIHLIAHSMGSLALSRAVINYIEDHGSNASPKFREIILAAPDIDAKIFKDQIVPKIVGHGPRMTLYASRRDYALQPSQWLRSGLARAGFIEAGEPLVVAGVETVDVSAVNTKFLWGLFQGHSYVGDRPAILEDMFQLLQFAKSADERSSTKKAILNNLPYWIMKRRAD